MSENGAYNVGTDSKSGSDDVYFAAKKPNETASILLNKAQSFFNTLRSNAYLDKVVKNWRAYHGIYADGMDSDHQIRFTGEQGELIQFPVNHFRNIARHIYTMVTASRPVMEARAINTDYKSLAQTYLANGILEYYMREKHLEEHIKRACEMAIVLGSGFIKMDWNATAGELYDFDPETNEAATEGELEFTNLSPFDVIVDGTKESWNHDWMMVRTFKNRYDLMAKYPELADKIRGIPSKNSATVYRLAMFSNDETDDIPVYEFYHKKTESMPDGRYLLFLSDDVTLLDAKIPYRTIPVFRIAPSDLMGTPYGYTDMFDAFPLQEVINSLYSTIITNQSAFGVQNVFVPRGADISLNQLGEGMNIIEGNAKPESMNLTETPAEVFKFLETVIQSLETISGVNSVARGNPEASLKSGTALALVQSMALQFMSGLQQSYVKLIEDSGTSLINILKDFSTTPKIVALVGKNNKSYLKEFTGDQIKDVNRVIVDMGNPLSHCLEKNTPIIMFDGSTKVVQNIKVGDLLMGPDSKPRTVDIITTGQDKMYKVRSKDKHRNVEYGCNENHILTLKWCSDGRPNHGEHWKKGEILDISIRDYNKLSGRNRRQLQGFTVGVEFQNKELPIDPYILGSWLGDGNCRNTAITTMDIEIETAWRSYASSLGLKLRKDENSNSGRAFTYYVTSGEITGKIGRNPMLTALKELELIENKHIPNYYLTASRKDRLELLAGLIDTDGHRTGETFLFTQKDDKLTNNVMHLAKSLGFRVTTRKKESTPSVLVPNAQGEINSVTIGGDTWEIPVKVERKKTSAKEKARDPLNYGISVESVGLGEYFGFTLREEPHFLLGDFTVTHNTVAGRVQMAEQMLQMKVITKPEQYIAVINTGRLDVTFEGEMNELLLIKSENERMLEGDAPLVSPLDQHRLHINEHKAVLSDPDLRKDAVLVKGVLDHIQGHLDALRNTDPDLLALVGEQALAPAGGMPPPGMDEQGQPTQESLQGSPMGNLMAPNEGQVVAGDSISGPNVQNIKSPGLPKVDPSLLPNPAMQEQVGNLRK